MNQPTLFGVVPQPRRAKPEGVRVHLAVLYLRALGLRVYRAGRDHHNVNGNIITTRELLERAGA